MAVALCVISFALGKSPFLNAIFAHRMSSLLIGLVSIELFCDHYFFVSPSLTSTQLSTCSAFYQNVERQPWYTSLITVIPIVIGAIVIFRNIRRTIYDTLSAPLLLAVLGMFVFRIKKYRELLTVETRASNSVTEGYLRQIANGHAIIVALLVLLLVLQSLAQRKTKMTAKKNV